MHLEKIAKVDLKDDLFSYAVGEVALGQAQLMDGKLMLVKVARNDTETVVNALIKNARKTPQELYKSLTWDRGLEMAVHRRFTLATYISVYFCDPHSPWQRGSNENTNGLLRQYLPKGLDISNYTQAQLNTVARKLNARPRKTHKL